MYIFLENLIMFLKENCNTLFYIIIIKANKMPIFFNSEEAKRDRCNEHILNSAFNSLSYYYCCFLRRRNSQYS